MDRELEVLAASYGNSQWINSFVAKGPIVIEWKNRDPWFVVDKKTEGYPFKGFVGRYILTGGNWVKSDRTAEVPPVHIYRTRIRDELQKN
jgi:hypothetical protein